ncbi:MAG: monovalent cation/H+ antiporter subunit D family protein [Verrucomicrobia bacterium]|nr:monovalent cation/H+ antiporter subunit D family protein [Verrucomicrobiota bacterium]MDA1067734.1 monovalent cation/H+ antiporter subunit D family protein [Verrucomicrobiota bacterium]
MTEQAPVLILLFPFLTAIVVALVGIRIKALCWPLVLLSLASSVWASLSTLVRVLESGTIRYKLGGWEPPFGIEFRIDGLNALVAVTVTIVALLAAIYSRDAVLTENKDKVSQYYTLFLLLIAGLLGMVITGDAFNLYVLLEISALTSYALLAMGNIRATLAAYKYLIMGTIGASFYLLGVGYLYIKTGSLNMVDINEQLVVNHLEGSSTILVAFILITVGVWIKMAFFPLHAWLPNAYSFAPTTSSAIMGPLVTKVMIYVMIRMVLTVFGPNYAFEVLNWDNVVVWLAVIAILAGSIGALAQKDLRKMLTFLIIAEVGYMVGGVWLVDETGMIGSIFHIISDAFMTLCVFLFAGIIYTKTGRRDINAVDGLFKKMPLTMIGFLVGAFSLIGIPPTAGFFSKWYLIQGGINSGNWEYVVALLFSSLVNAVLFFRIIEVAHFGVKPAEGHDAHHGDHHAKISEGSMTQVLPLLATAAIILSIGIYNKEIVSIIQDFVSQFNLVAGI